MAERKIIVDDSDPAQKINAELPNHFMSDAAFCAAVDIGLAQIEAGQTIPFETVVANLRRKTAGRG